MKPVSFCHGLLIFVLPFAACSIALAQPENISPTDEYREIASRVSVFVQHELKQKKIPALSIAIVDGDKIVWAQGFGYADESTKAVATARSVYRVGSVSKLLSDVAVVQLIEKGDLELDADITDVIPKFSPRNPFGQPITLRHLMNHQSGLVRESPVGNYFDPNEPSLEETVMSLNRTELVHAPNTRTKYSNAAVSVAGLAMERVTGTDFAEHMKLSLLEPLGMNDSSYLSDDEVRRRLVKATMWSYDGRQFDAPEFALGTLPAGNLYSTVIDLGKFMGAIFNNGRVNDQQVIDSQLLKEMLQPQTGPDGQKRSYGIGFRIGSLDDRPTFEHGGAVYGFSTQFRGLANEKLGVIAVASRDVSNGFVNHLTNSTLRMALANRAGQPLPELSSAGSVDKDFARRVAGLFHDGSQFRRLFESGGRLMLSGATYTNEIRTRGDSLVVEDALTGPLPISFANESFTFDDRTWNRVEDAMPEPVPNSLSDFVGEYGWPHNKLFIYERQGQLWCLIEWVFHYPLAEVSQDVFAFPDYGLYHEEHLVFQRTENGDIQSVVAAEVEFDRLDAGPRAGETFRIQPLLPAHRLREIALAAEPRTEARDFLDPDLVELNLLDPTIKLDIRYSTTNNFMGMVFYEEPRAFMQRPAAEAVVRAHRKLNELGYGLLIHDAYRPWFVTRMFWDATPQSMRHFVANPQNGSRHNRGCAVDLTLYELESGKVVPMVAGYDEFSERAYPDYPGGTSLQRWHRRLLRDTMEAEGFEIYEFEWWHFDFNTWQNYPILNKRFSELVE